MERVRLYPYQRSAVNELASPGKHIVVATMGAGKSAIALNWAMTTPTHKWLVVTTASARDSGQWFREQEMWCKSLSSSLSAPTYPATLEVISWQALAKWTMANWNSLDEYTFIFDEVQKAKAGVSSNRGRAFLQITNRTNWWAGFTGTPGDCWMDFYAYMVAGGFVRNKTEFKRRFVIEQHYKGYPEITGYANENVLQDYWASLTVCPDTSEMLAQLPAELHHTIHFKPDPYYRTLMRTHKLKDGTLLDTTGAFCAAARRLCFTKAKQQWLADYLEGLGEPTVLFYNFTETGDRICEIAAKVLPKHAHVWRICGGVHDIPTAETIGSRDIVVCQWQAGAEALNLQFMSEWVSVEPCYAYGTSEQARGRIKRIGQKQNMEFWYLKADKTIEEDIYAALKNKSEFSEENWIIDKFNKGK